MFEKLVKWFEENTQSHVEQKHTVELATAVLFYEIIRADDTLLQSEIDLKKRLLNAHFNLTENDVTRLCDSASLTAAHAVDFSQFTRVIHENCDVAEKKSILLSLWKLALADKVLDPHEEYLIRKVSDLLYLDHKHFIQTKHEAQSLVNEIDMG